MIHDSHHVSSMLPLDARRAQRQVLAPCRARQVAPGFADVADGQLLGRPKREVMWAIWV
jgi:hypothetical protein